MDMKTLHEKDVHEAMVLLLDSFDFITTLQIKERLQKVGFWAVQDVVSEFVANIFKKGLIVGLVRKVDGDHFAYYVLSAVMSVDPDPIATDSPLTVVKPTPRPWVAYLPTDHWGHADEEYDGNLTRSAVRWRFAKKMGVSYNNVRAKRFELVG